MNRPLEQLYPPETVAAIRAEIRAAVAGILADHRTAVADLTVQTVTRLRALEPLRASQTPAEPLPAPEGP